MRRLLVFLALFLACVSLSVDAAQSKRLRLRVGAAATGGDGGARALLDESDIDWECASDCGVAVIPYYLQDGVTRTANESNLGSKGGYVVAGGLAWNPTASQFISTADSSLSNGISGEPYTFTCSSFSTAGTWPPPACTLVSEYANAYDCKRVNIADTCDNSVYRGPTGLYHDGTYLWATYSADPYSNAGSYPGVPLNPCLLKLDISSGDGTGIAAYRFEDVIFKLCAGSLMPIPSVWQSSFGGHDFFLSNNGYTSGADASINLTMYAMDLPSGAHLSTVPATDFKQVIWGGFGECSNTSDRTVRPSWLPTVVYDFADLNTCTPSTAWWGEPSNGNLQHRTWLDADDSCVAIETGDGSTTGRYGILCHAIYAWRGIAYTSASVGSNGYKTGFDVYDPADLAAVYAGSQTVGQPQVINAWEDHLPFADYGTWPLSPFIDTTVTGVVKDQANDRYRFTFSGTPPAFVNAIGAKFTAWGGSTISGGFNVFATGSNYVDTCLGQASAQPCGVVGNASDSGPMTLDGYSGGATLGTLSGLTYMPTNSGCNGANKMIAAIYDVPTDTGAGTYYFRFIRCGKVIN